MKRWGIDMTYFDLRDLQKQIHAQKLKVAQMRENATKTELSIISDMPKGRKTSDKLSETICNILYEEQILDDLERQLKNSVKAIPNGLTGYKVKYPKQVEFSDDDYLKNIKLLNDMIYGEVDENQ